MPPRRPPRHRWTPDDVQGVLEELIISADEVDGLSPLLRACNSAIEALTHKGLNSIGQADADQQHQVPYLASIAIMDALGTWCLQEAQERAINARTPRAATADLGAWDPIPWSEIAAATGFASGDSAANHFDPARKERRAAAARQRRAAAKANDTQ